MQVMYNAQVFSRIFASNRRLFVAYLSAHNQINPIECNRCFSLKGSLCFAIINNICLDDEGVELFIQTKYLFFFYSCLCLAPFCVFS